MFPGGLDMQQLLEQAQQMQQQVASAQEELEAERAQGSAGGGLVTATVTGTGELVALDIAPEACDPDDPASAESMATVADLVVAAVRDATRAAKELAADRLGPLAQGIGALGGPGGLPGGDATGAIPPPSGG